jgi:hypothetical protein
VVSERTHIHCLQPNVHSQGDLTGTADDSPMAGLVITANAKTPAGADQQGSFRQDAVIETSSNTGQALPPTSTARKAVALCKVRSTARRKIASMARHDVRSVLPQMCHSAFRLGPPSEKLERMASFRYHLPARVL